MTGMTFEHLKLTGNGHPLHSKYCIQPCKKPFQLWNRKNTLSLKSRHTETVAALQ